MQKTWIKALTQLGFRQTSLYLWYLCELKSGYLRWKTKAPIKPKKVFFQPSFQLPKPEQLSFVLGSAGLASLYAEANEIVAGKVKLFGGESVKLDLVPPSPKKHWTLYRDMQQGDHQDIKFIWEPARFGWAITLARAYFLSCDERYTDAFWKFTNIFLENNPAYLGINWVSAQEVALRLTALAFSGYIFSSSPHSSSEQVARLAESISQHADRIPPSLVYARAQNNNHLLTEAAGLMTASNVLPAHPSAKKWYALGWQWFHQGLQTQIASDGSYNQHSANYHRLMLQIALWVQSIAQASGSSFPNLSLDRLAAATRWLLMVLDPLSGGVPNLGPNDGAYIFPFSVLPFHDFRPVLQAAGEAFIGKKILPDGIWDEMSLWMCTQTYQSEQLADRKKPENQPDQDQAPTPSSPLILRSPAHSWAYLRVAHFNSRPGHADQLHLDIWWRGINLALDPGTYLYNAPVPWDNALTSTFVHNTITINQAEQMTRAGRFLYLDWAQAAIHALEFAREGGIARAVCNHSGYERFGIIHQRSVESCADGWNVEDRLLPIKGKYIESTQARLHWLLPDWEWDLNARETGIDLNLHSPFGWIGMQVNSEDSTGKFSSTHHLIIELIRAGQVIAPVMQKSASPNPTWGWFSPTYGVKIPALSFSIQARGRLPITFKTHWKLV